MYASEKAWTPDILRKAAKAIDEATDAILSRWVNNFFGTVDNRGNDIDP
tara:strand:- start:4421 stop:4567 length:147 start_codon:yes stop_codon:yes gene_type:complete